MILSAPKAAPVAPHAGAWIETAHNSRAGRGKIVAPHAGAWIETDIRRVLFPRQKVAPHAGAWIETFIHVDDDTAKLVAPHAGAWIETVISSHFNPLSMSPLTRGRGLKHRRRGGRAGSGRSPLTRGRGLKLFIVQRDIMINSRPSRGGVD